MLVVFGDAPPRDVVFDELGGVGRLSLLAPAVGVQPAEDGKGPGLWEKKCLPSSCLAPASRGEAIVLLKPFQQRSEPRAEIGARRGTHKFCVRSLMSVAWAARAGSLLGGSGGKGLLLSSRGELPVDEDLLRWFCGMIEERVGNCLPLVSWLLRAWIDRRVTG